jgi:hypothetical protein
MEEGSKTTTLPYEPERMKAIQKKLDSSDRKESVIEIKGLVSNQQVVISLDSARCEISKEFLPRQERHLRGSSSRKKEGSDEGCNVEGCTP